MALDLSTYTSLQTNIFVKLDIPNYGVETFSDYYKSFTFGGTTYQGLGSLLGVSNTTNNLRATSNELTISIAGIPTSNIQILLQNKIKGSSVLVYRAFFDPITSSLLNISGNPAGKFQGVINNFEIADDLDGNTGAITLTLSATSVVDLLNNKITGRRTNPIDEEQFYPGDLSMERVPSLARSNFNFGAPV